MHIREKKIFVGAMMSFITYWFRCSRAIIFKRCCLLTIFANPLSEPRIFAPPLAARDLTDFTEGFLSDGQNRFRGIRQIRDVRGSDYKRAEEIEYTAFTINLLPRFQIHPSPFTLHPSPFALHPSPFALRPSPFTLRPSPFALRIGIISPKILLSL